MPGPRLVPANKTVRALYESACESVPRAAASVRAGGPVAEKDLWIVSAALLGSFAVLALVSPATATALYGGGAFSSDWARASAAPQLALAVWCARVALRGKPREARDDLVVLAAHYGVALAAALYTVAGGALSALPLAVNVAVNGAMLYSVHVARKGD